MWGSVKKVQALLPTTLHHTFIRALDLTAAVFGGVLLLPIVFTAGLLIRLDSSGPALFRQERVGRKEKIFVCYKLRTMANGTDSVGSHEVAPSSVTRIGRWLRRLKIDELPQLWNVMKGEMSLVGPRPCLPIQTVLIQARRKRNVYDVRPGITGRAQIVGLDMSTPEQLAIEDAIWAANPNVIDYIRLVFQTVTGKGLGDAISS